MSLESKLEEKNYLIASTAFCATNLGDKVTTYLNFVKYDATSEMNPIITYFVNEFGGEKQGLGVYFILSTVMFIGGAYVLNKMFNKNYETEKLRNVGTKALLITSAIYLGAEGNNILQYLS